jgi:hypothetical protein
MASCHAAEKSRMPCLWFFLRLPGGKSHKSPDL